MYKVGLVVGVILLWVGCHSQRKEGKTAQTEEYDMTISVVSSAFKDGEMIPRQYTCDGRDISPPLTWTGIPEGTQSLVLICEDPDAPAGVWVHWVIYNMPPSTGELPEAVPGDETLSSGARHGVNDFGRPGYGGPCPPRGIHRYIFTLYAVDSMLDLSGKVAKHDVERAMEGRMLGKGELMGKYRRQ